MCGDWGGECVEIGNHHRVAVREYRERSAHDFMEASDRCIAHTPPSGGVRSITAALALASRRVTWVS